MADKSKEIQERYEQLRQSFEKIRDERSLYANTATRIGKAFLDLLDFFNNGADNKYLSKVADDIANGVIDFLKGVKLNGSDALTGVASYPDTSEDSKADVVTPKYVKDRLKDYLQNLDDRYISKIKDDLTNFLVTFMKGIKIGKDYKFDENGDVVANNAELQSLRVKGDSVFDGSLSSPKFIEGFLDGFGWKIWGEAVKNAAGVLEQKYTGEFDNIIVRGTLRVFEMIISQLLGENDNRVFTGMLEVDHYDAETRKVYLDTNEGRYYNPFRKDDYIMVQQYNGLPSEENDYYVTKRYELIVTEVGSEGTGEDMLAWVKFKNFTSTMEGATPEKLIKKKDTFVRVDNLSDDNRKGIVTITTVGPKTPYMDIIYGLKTDPDNALKGRLGNLQGITHPLFGELKGFGELLQNLYAVGDLVLRRTGENIDTKFQILEDLFSSQFSKTEYDLSDDANYLHNGQFLTTSVENEEDSIIDGWDIDDSEETAFWIDANGMPVMVNGYATTGGNKRVIVERTQGRQMLRIANCGISQKNSLIKQPTTHKEYSKPSGKDNTQTDSKGNNAVTTKTATDGSSKDVQDKLYVSLRMYAITAGKLTIGFSGSTDVAGKTNDLAVRTMDIPYSGEWQTVEFNGTWNGTGDFVISYTGDCRIAFATVTDTALENLSKTVSTSIEQTAEAIKLLGQNDDAIAGKYTSLGLTIDALNNQVDIFVNQTYKNDMSSIDNRIKVNADGISALSTKLDNTNNTVTQLGVDINSLQDRVDVFVNKTYADDLTETRRLISVNANGIDINAKDIDSLNGTVSTLGTNYNTLSQQVTTYVSEYQDGYNKLDSRITTNTNNISAESTRIGNAESRLDSAETRLGTAEGNITTHATRLTNAENGINTNTSDINSLNDDISGLNGKYSDLNTKYGNLQTSYNSVQSFVTKMGVYFDDNGNPIGDKWTEAGILTTSEGNILYAGKGESSDNLLVGTGSGLLWEFTQSKQAAQLDFSVNYRMFTVTNYFPIGEVSFSNSNNYAYAYLTSPVAKVESGKYYVLSFSVSTTSTFDFYIRYAFGSTSSAANAFSNSVWFSNRDDSETVHTTGRMLRYSKHNDGTLVRYYIILKATSEYMRVQFVNRISKSQVTTTTSTSNSVQSGIPGDSTISQNSGRQRVTRTYSGTSRSDGKYDVTCTTTTMTSGSGTLQLRKIQLEPAVNDDLSDVCPSSYKEGQNTMESYIKQTVDSIEMYADKIIFTAEHVMTVSAGQLIINAGNFTLNDKGVITAEGATFTDCNVTGTFRTGSGTNDLVITSSGDSGSIELGNYIDIGYNTTAQRTFGGNIISWGLQDYGGHIKVLSNSINKYFGSANYTYETLITGLDIQTNFLFGNCVMAGSLVLSTPMTGSVVSSATQESINNNMASALIMTNSSEYTVYLPKSPYRGQIFLVVQGSAKLTISGNGNKIWSNGSKESVTSNTVGQWNWFIYDGAEWCGIYVNNRY